MNVSFLACAAMTALSAFISLGFSIAFVTSAAGLARALGLYACARSLALAIVSLVPFANGSMQWLEAAATAMIIVQICDAIVGASAKDRGKTFGPAGVALANVAALVWAMSA